MGWFLKISKKIKGFHDIRKINSDESSGQLTKIISWSFKYGEKISLRLK